MYAALLAASILLAQATQPTVQVTEMNLSAREQAALAALVNPDDAINFVATRTYVHACQRVLAGKLASSDLPNPPAGFSSRFLFPAETNIINRAVALSNNPQTTFIELTPAQIVKPAAFTDKELAVYKTLTDPAAKSRYIATRSYVRVCKLEVAGKLPAAQLPDKPLGYVGTYLLPGEKTIVDQAAAASAAARATPSPH